MGEPAGFGFIQDCSLGVPSISALVTSALMGNHANTLKGPHMQPSEYAAKLPEVGDTVRGLAKRITMMREHAELTLQAALQANRDALAHIEAEENRLLKSIRMQWVDSEIEFAKALTRRTQRTAG